MSVNMDYCKFQNTLRALEQCVEDGAIYERSVEEDEDGTKTPSGDEHYRKKLIALCRDIAENAEE